MSPRRRRNGGLIVVSRYRVRLTEGFRVVCFCFSTSERRCRGENGRVRAPRNIGARERFFNHRCGAAKAEKTSAAENLRTIVSGKVAVSIIGINVIYRTPGLLARSKVHTGFLLYAIPRALPTDRPPTAAAALNKTGGTPVGGIRSGADPRFSISVSARNGGRRTAFRFRGGVFRFAFRGHVFPES